MGVRLRENLVLSDQINLLLGPASHGVPACKFPECRQRQAIGGPVKAGETLANTASPAKEGDRVDMTCNDDALGGRTGFVLKHKGGLDDGSGSFFDGKLRGRGTRSSVVIASDEFDLNARMLLPPRAEEFERFGRHPLRCVIQISQYNEAFGLGSAKKPTETL